MIHLSWLRDQEVIAVRPEGELDEEDFGRAATMIDPVIDARGRLEGLMVDARGFSGWDDAKALLAHIRFVHEHQPKVARIAVVGDQWWLNAASAMEPFYGSLIRVFRGNEEEAAKAWLLKSAPVRPSITLLPESGPGLVGVQVTGRLRDADYARFQSELQKFLTEDGKLRLLAIMDEDFRGWTPKACLDDLAMAFSPWRERFEKLAVVAGPGLVRWCTAHFPDALLPYPVKVFSPDEVDVAWEWLKK